jgi:alpha-L-fucosidase
MYMKRLLVVLFLFSFQVSLIAQSYTPTKENGEAREWFQNAKYGLFVHWGPFSIPGSGEWVMNNRNITVANYTRLKDFFNPVDFNPQEWVSTAKRAGMKYITFITRHHDGFSLWDTKHSDFNIMHTPYKKDILKMLADECRKQDMKLFLYYSLLDWRRDDYSYWTGNTGKGTGRTKRGNWEDYLQFMKNQLTELLTNYGEIGGIWFDGYWDQLDNSDHDNPVSRVNWRFREIYDLIHNLQPQCLVGNNHHITPLPGEDFQMFEKDLPGGNTTGFGGASVSSLPLETCETMNNSWGFNITDTTYKSVKGLVHYMVKAAGHNSNFLLNVGPMPNGKIQPEFTDTLLAMGQWMARYGESIYGTRGNVIPPQEWGVITRKNKTFYVHLLNRPTSQPYIFIPGLNQKIKSATAMKGKSSVKTKQVTEGTFVYLDGVQADDLDSIIVLQLQ